MMRKNLIFTILPILLLFGCATSGSQKAPDKPYEVTKEVYDKAFSDIRTVINQLTGIIAAKDYERWTKYLTPKYIAYHSSPAVLGEFNQKFREKGYSTQLETLNDFFLYVVVPSRSANARLDQIVFVNPRLVRAYTKFGGNRALLYYLEQNNGQWKISVE